MLEFLNENKYNVKNITLKENLLMAECSWCGKKLGFLSGEVMPFGILCGNCSELNMKAQKGNDDQLHVLNGYVDQVTDKATKEYLVALIEDVRDKKAKKAEKEAYELKLKAAKETYELKLKNVLLNTGYNFEGYRIIKYCNIISAETVLGTGIFSELSLSVHDFFGTASNTYQSKLAEAKQSVQEKLKAIAVNIGANAIIGIDFDIMTLSNNALMVSANGTAVVVERIES